MSPTTLVLIAIAIAIVLWVASRVHKNNGPAAFSARVSGALFDLGLQVMKLEGPLKANLSRETLAYYGALNEKANAQVFAARFFLRATTEYPAFTERALMFDGVLVRSIAVVRDWKTIGRIPEKPADAFILEVKKFLIDEINSQRLPTEQRLAMEIQVLEL
jgi:hypothetical protein